MNLYRNYRRRIVFKTGKTGENSSVGPFKIFAIQYDSDGLSDKFSDTHQFALQLDFEFDRISITRYAYAIDDSA